jgi:hypothetical protein
MLCLIHSGVSELITVTGAEAQIGSQTFFALAEASAPTPEGVGFHLSGLQQL